MNLCKEICAVLDASGMDYTVENICGYDVISVGTKTAEQTRSCDTTPKADTQTGTGKRATEHEAVIIPVKITATDLETAEHDAEALRKAVGEALRQTGIYPLTITEDRWRLQQEMMTSRILAHVQIFTQIYARNCEVRKIDKQTAAEFLQANHSYGDAKCRYRYGLYLKRHTGHNSAIHIAADVTTATDAAAETASSTTIGTVTDSITKTTTDSITGEADTNITTRLLGRYIAPGTLVAVGTFSNARKWVKGDKAIRSYEWTRYASLPGVRLSGGMGKLLKAFIDEVHPDDIMTYADLEWSEGKVYEALGFVLEGHKGPVSFTVDSSWSRRPVKNETLNPSSLPITTSLRAKRGDLYFRNLGSNKYRLKLTDYQ